MSKRKSELIDSLLSDKDDKNITVAPALRVSNYQDETADIELKSKEGVKYLVHKANLSSGSRVFANMFTIGSANAKERPIIELEESSEVLDEILPYFYPNRVVHRDKDLQDDWECISALFKFEIWRGLDSVELTLLKKIESVHANAEPPEFWFYAYVYLSHVGALTNDKALERSILSSILEEVLNSNRINKKSMNEWFDDDINLPPFLDSCFDEENFTNWVQTRRIFVADLYFQLGENLKKENGCSMAELIDWMELGNYVTSNQITKFSKKIKNPSSVKKNLKKIVTEFISKLKTIERNDEGP